MLRRVMIDTAYASAIILIFVGMVSALVTTADYVRSAWPKPLCPTIHIKSP